MRGRLLLAALCVLVAVFSAPPLAGAGGPESGESQPETIQQAIEAVKEMLAQGKDRQEIAAWITKVVDERIVSLNQDTADESEQLSEAEYEEAVKTLVAWSERGNETDEVFGAAHWCWDHRIGHCQENAFMAAHILLMATEDTRRIGILHCGDHYLVIWGLPKDFAGTVSLEQMNKWENAITLDPWNGSCKAATEMDWADLGGQLKRAGVWWDPDLMCVRTHWPRRFELYARMYSEYVSGACWEGTYDFHLVNLDTGRPMPHASGFPRGRFDFYVKNGELRADALIFGGTPFNAYEVKVNGYTAQGSFSDPLPHAEQVWTIVLYLTRTPNGAKMKGTYTYCVTSGLGDAATVSVGVSAKRGLNRGDSSGE